MISCGFWDGQSIGGSQICKRCFHQRNVARDNACLPRRTQKFVKKWPHWDAIFAIQMVTDYHDAKLGIRRSKYHLEQTRPNGTQTISGATILDVGGCSDTAAWSQSRGAKFPSTMASRRNRLRAGVGERCWITIVLVLQSERVAASVTAVTSVLRG
jgi:hypothetical protein